MAVRTDGSAETPSYASIVRSRIVLVVAVVVLAACSGNESLIDPDIDVARSFDFVGDVVNVEFGSDWSMNPPSVALASGDSNPGTTVGPQTIVLGDGQRLHVPAGTPGGNTCLALIHPSQAAGITGDENATVKDVPRWETNRDWSLPCVVAGQFADDSTVSWFVVFEVVEYEGAQLADIGSVNPQSLDEGFITTRRGYRVPTTVEHTDCGLPIGEAADTKALLDWTTGEATALVCLFGA